MHKYSFINLMDVADLSRQKPFVHLDQKPCWQIQSISTIHSDWVGVVTENKDDLAGQLLIAKAWVMALAMNRDRVYNKAVEAENQLKDQQWLYSRLHEKHETWLCREQTCMV